MIIWEYNPELTTMTNPQLEQAIIDEGVEIANNDGRLSAGSSASLDLHFENIEVLLGEVRRRAVEDYKNSMSTQPRWWQFWRMT